LEKLQKLINFYCIEKEVYSITLFQILTKLCNTRRTTNCLAKWGADQKYLTSTGLQTMP